MQTLQQVALPIRPRPIETGTADTIGLHFEDLVIPVEVASLSAMHVDSITSCFRRSRSIAMKRTPAEEYVENAKLLTKEETERLMSRIRAKLMRRLKDKKLSDLEILAIQLEIEDEDLNEWREKMAELSKKSKTKKSD